MHTTHGEPAQSRHRSGEDRVRVRQDPDIDFTKIAQGMGVFAEGPITNPKDLGPAIQRARAIDKRGEPALLDVVTQPR